jgi:hypothetical protein
MPAMDVLRSVYFDLMEFVLYPVLYKVLRPMPRPDDLQDCFTVEIEEDTKWDSSLTPSLASALPSHSELKAASASDHDMSLCLDFLKDTTQDLMKQPWLDNRYRTLIKDQALKNSSRKITSYFTMPSCRSKPCFGPFESTWCLSSSVSSSLQPITQAQETVMHSLKLPSGNCASAFTGLTFTLMLDGHVTNVLVDLSRT